ncbi:hypothetical protein [Rhodohalobacter sp. 8-1]|uniref:hypothetical protein n=1 Tax=Rhodohalobacter sp. 8-1 TaxID=3131972 RepID=UPI0030EC7C20
MLQNFQKPTASLFSLIILTLLFTWPTHAQICSCAGAPLLGTQSSGASEAGNVLIGVTYEFNQITNLYTGSEQITNDSANRNTQSALIEINYGITDRLSASGTFSYVRKQRTSGIGTPGETQTSTTAGIGDGIALLRYTLLPQSLWNRYYIAAGGGVKAPIGSTTLNNPNGRRFNADMQPGTVATDGVLWSNLGLNFLPISTINLSLTNSYRLTGTNERFVEGDDYRFGNEFISILGLSDTITDRISYKLKARYRSTSSDERNDNVLPNTGGKWITLIPDLYITTSDQTSIKLSGQIPLYHELNGLQPSTTYAVSASFFININSSQNTFIHANN